MQACSLTIGGILMAYKAFLFDLDGTLSDSKIGITKSVQYALNKYGIVSSLENLEKFVGPPLQDSFVKYYDFDMKKADEAVAYFREYFSEFGIYENQPYEGILELLKALSEEPVTLYIATSKPTIFAKTILEKDQLAPYFKVILGSELNGTRSQKREVIADLINMEALKSHEVLMIGDREHDLLGAKSNGVDAVGVLYGYGDYNELKACNPIKIVESVKDLKAYLLRVI